MTRSGLLAAERALHAAQLAGDVAALDRLLHDRLVAVGPDGATFTKEDDLAGYRSGASVVTELSVEDLEVVVAGSTGTAFVTAEVAGTFGEQPMSARLRYGRTWVHDDEGGWRVLGALLVVLPPDG